MKRTYTVDENWIDVVGEIWQPGIGPCADVYLDCMYPQEGV